MVALDSKNVFFSCKMSIFIYSYKNDVIPRQNILGFEQPWFDKKKSIHESLNQMTIMCHAQHHHFKIVFDIRLLFRLFS